MSHCICHQEKRTQQQHTTYLLKERKDKRIKATTRFTSSDGASKDKNGRKIAYWQAPRMKSGGPLQNLRELAQALAFNSQTETKLETCTFQYSFIYSTYWTDRTPASQFTLQMPTKAEHARGCNRKLYINLKSPMWLAETQRLAGRPTSCEHAHQQKAGMRKKA